MGLDGRPPTMLRTPGRYGQWLPNERILPGSASDYITDQDNQGWLLVVTLEDRLVYFGPGPTSVMRSPAPSKCVKRACSDSCA